MKTRALVLFAHGARDARWAVPFERLQALVQQQSPDAEVALAFLELMTPRLPELVQGLEDKGITEVTIVPVFFGRGGHLLRDLPEMVAQLKHDHPELTMKVAGAVGEDDGVLNAIAKYCVDSLGSQ
ncbi:MAG TPA: CbiX/SirB N-terminal domain-containing protein [Noviherbaspirillum sp.]|jgi:sirohydrochlorin cobaltochelatase|uniref:sirohydrochlorin chelatase n=1 Tax=Noviherbaspirillum sp. TaxID=1926288 RepID=UPI002DDD4C8A|nr:CbiX/SirB N-terminal domain-containing protein [Noviherbaspirillum sp.]HEV2609111.1 CbiX/SirB N-terminal domain-containing protein [Noviherbaspirillum sp.]